MLAKPDFAATDGVRTTFFAQLIGGVERFFGTSAAAPQAAAVGALLREFDPGLLPVGIMTTLHNTGQRGRYQRVSNGSRRRVHRRRRGARKRQTAVPPRPCDRRDERKRPSHRELDRGADESRLPRHPLCRDPAARHAPAQTPTTFNSAATSEVVTGLTNGATYTFKVAAFNANGSGPPSAPGGATSSARPARRRR